MRPIDLAGFDARFAGDDDPWATFTSRDEAVKRAAILHACGVAPLGRVLEVAAGNGSNSVALAARALALDATEGTASGTALVARAIRGARGARASVLVLPGRPPRGIYDTIVVAELLYYLRPCDMARVARETGRVLRPGGRLVLAHHRVDFHDFAQHADGIHARFLAATGRRWRPLGGRRNGRWRVEGFAAR